MGNSPHGAIVWRESLESWQGWQAPAQVRQSFWMAGHTKRLETTLEVALILGWMRDCKEPNT